MTDNEISVNLHDFAGEIIRKAQAHAIRTASEAFRGQHITSAPDVTAWLDAYADSVERDGLEEQC